MSRSSDSLVSATVLGAAAAVMMGSVGGVGGLMARPTAMAVTAPSPAVDRVLKLAGEQTGITESPKGSNRQKFGAEYGWNGVAWCAQFVWWVFDRAAAGGALGIKTASVLELKDHFAKAARFTQDPRPGDVVIFDFGGGRTHTGLVKEVEDKTVTTIEGNTSASSKGSQSNGGTVAEKKRPRNGNIVGYGRPLWGAA